MLSIKILRRQDVGRAASYYEDGADDYYAKEGEASAWQGKGAEFLGLAGPVDDRRLRELLAGRVGGDPPSRVHSRHDANARIGIDLTFSAPKSVSLQALIGGDSAIIRAHDLAVERALAIAEERAQARSKQRGRSRVEDTGNLVVAKFRHETSRERDPQLHTHALVLNLTRRRDGEWRALRNDQIVKATKYLGAAYRAELAVELQRAGYSLRHGRGGSSSLPTSSAASSRRSAGVPPRSSGGSPRAASPARPRPRSRPSSPPWLPDRGRPRWSEWPCSPSGGSAPGQSGSSSVGKSARRTEARRFGLGLWTPRPMERARSRRERRKSPSGSRLPISPSAKRLSRKGSCSTSR